MNGLRAPLLLSLALLLLHVAATFPIVFSWSGLGADASRGSGDLLILVAMVLVGGAIGRPRLAANLATIGMLVWTGFRRALVMVPLNLEREFEFSDFMRLPAYWHLLMHDEPVSTQVFTVGLWVVELAFAYAVVAWCFLRIARTGAEPRRALVVAGVLQACVLGSVIHSSLSPAAVSLWHPSTATVVARKAWFAIQNAIDPSIVDQPILARIAEGSDTMTRSPRDLAKLDGADVHFVILESYGRVAQTHAELATHFREVYRELLPQVRAAGFAVASSAGRPAISGGGSWLAHAQLWTSVRMDTQRGWELLLESDCLTLPKVFTAAGYRTIEVAPAMDRHWPEGKAFYGFTDEVTQVELDYTGKLYHWGRMPDQFALHHLLENYVEPARTGPVFTSFLSVTNHLPFRWVPPYVEDWCIDRDTFAGPPRVDHHTAIGSVTRPPVIVPAFRDTLDYSLRTIVGFVTRLKRPSLVVVIGDHQPPFCKLLEPPERSFDVMMHVFSNRPELLQPLLAGGFIDGFEIPATMEAFDTTEFAPTFLRIYSK